MYQFKSSGPVGAHALLAFPPVSSDEMDIAFINMGQGDCTIISTPTNKVIIIDGGSVADGDSMETVEEAKQVVKAWSAGQDVIIILTHPDMDHINKIMDLLTYEGKTNKVETIYFSMAPAAGESKGPLYHYNYSRIQGTIEGGTIGKPDLVEVTFNTATKATRTWEFDKEYKGTITPQTITDGKKLIASGRTIEGSYWEVAVIAGNVPSKSKSDGVKKNTGSLCTLVTFDDQTLLLPGDATKETLAFLETTHSTLLRDLTILHVPHHGSGLSIPPESLRTLFNPKQLVVSAGLLEHKNHLPRLDALTFWVQGTRIEKQETPMPVDCWYRDLKTYESFEERNAILTDAWRNFTTDSTDSMFYLTDPGDAERAGTKFFAVCPAKGFFLERRMIKEELHLTGVLDNKYLHFEDEHPDDPDEEDDDDETFKKDLSDSQMQIANLDELEKLINSCFTGEDFLFDTTNQSENVKNIGANYLVGAKLKLSKAQVKKLADKGIIQVMGTGVNQPFKNLPVTVDFYLLNNEAAFEMTAVPPADWTLDKSIPAFKGTIANDIRFKKGAETPALYLLSDAKDKLTQGLSFYATIDLDIMPDGLKDLLSISTLDINGPIVLQNKAKELVSINFTGPSIGNVNIGTSKNLSVSFSITADTFGAPSHRMSVAVPYIQLGTAIPFSGETDIPISAKISSFSSSFIRFEANIDKLIKTSLKAVASLAGDVNLNGVLPSDFKIEEKLTFSNLYIDYNKKEKKFDVVGLGLKSDNPWEIFTIKSTGETRETFNAKDIDLQFTVFNPFGSDRRSSLYLGGNIELTVDADLFISAKYPNFSVEGHLTDESTFNIRDFINRFVGESSKAPDLLIEELNFNKDPKGYTFKIGLSDAWPINPEQSAYLSIEELSFDTEYNSAAKEQTANFSGQLQIGELGMQVTAAYSNVDKVGGWVFNGEATDIPIGKFINYLGETFGAGTAPDWVCGINLSKLETSFNTEKKNFDFGVTGGTSIGNNNDIEVSVKFAMNKAKEAYKKTLSGKLTIGKAKFNLKIASDEGKNDFSAKWTAVDASGYLQFSDIVSKLGLGDFPSIPDGLNLSLVEASLYYNFTDKTLVLKAKSEKHGKAVFVAKKNEEEKWIYVFVVNFKAEVDLGDLPLVGSDLKSVAGDVGLKGFKLIGVSDTIKADDIESINQLINREDEEDEEADIVLLDEDDDDYPTLPESEKDLLKAVYVVIDLKLSADNDYKVEFNTSKKKQEKLLLLDDAANSDGTKWIDLQKRIGPVYFDRAGVGYKDGRVSLLLDAALVFSALKIEMMSLGVSNPIDKVSPAFALSGVNIAYKSGPVEIGASFLRTVGSQYTEYSGTALISLKNIRISALGSYASVNNETSLFIFAMLNSALGGPPCFFVTGLVAGFGYNRGLKLPNIDDVADFPLVAGLVPGKQSPFTGPDPKDALKKLNSKGIVPVAIGQNWLAAGVQFTSFQLVQAYALLPVTFGTNVEIGVIGVAAVSVPPKSKEVVAFAQLALNARILPDAGVVSVEARLTPASYILSKKCTLTGGFAFYVWLSPHKNEGDFVLTLGGYHPNFTVPAHYPKVPRLGFNWQISKEILVKGAMYFAITPDCLMAGGVLEATFNSGNLKAWFIMGADFLIAWKPFYYQARMYISFGVSYTFQLDLLFTTITETISVSLGADLSVWGPDFSGIARIHLWIISFDISFGAAVNKEPDAIKWADFVESFLPKSNKTAQHLALYGHTAEQPTDTYCYTKVTNGLVKDMQVDDRANANLNWIVNRDNTIFETYSIYPAKECTITINDAKGKVKHTIINQEELDGRNKNFGVGMVNVENADFYTKHEVTVQLDTELTTKQGFEVTAILRSVPKSLWEKRVTGFGDKALINNVLVGFRITAKALEPKESTPVDLKDLAFSSKPFASLIKPARPTFIAGPDNKDGMKTLKETINNAEVKQIRQNIVNKLIARGKNLPKEINTKEIAERADDYIMAAPVLAYTYWKKSA